MSPVSHDPIRLPVRILALAGLAGLAALTLMDRGATRMFATPWTLLLAAIITVPPIILLLRLAGSRQPIRLPSAKWMLMAAVTITIPVASALLSPYRGPSLLNAGVPVSAACLMILVFDWLQANPGQNRVRLEQGFSAAAALVALFSTCHWLSDVSSLTLAELFSPVIFEMRNPHPLGHSNYTAGLMLLALPALARSARREHGLFRYAAMIATGMALLNLFMSGSRGGLLGLTALGVTGVAMSGLGWKRILQLTACLIALVALLAIANPRIRSLLGPRDSTAKPNLSTVQRSAMFDAGVAMGMDRPLLGWGPGTTPLAYPRYRHALDGGAENVLQLHSTPLQLWAETGVPGLLAALLLGALVAGNWQRAPVAAATLAGYSGLALTDYQLDVPAFAAALAALVGLLIPPVTSAAASRHRLSLGLMILIAGGLIVLLGARDRTPHLNTVALTLANDPAQHDRAVSLLEESLTLNPDQEIAHFNLGWLLVVSDPTRAERHFAAAIRLVPDKGGVYFGLGLARLNQGRNDAAAHAFALECLNEPRFIASPWWQEPAIASQRSATAAAISRLIARAQDSMPASSWAARQAGYLATLTPRLGQVSAGPEASYRRERIGYPVLMRNLDLAPPHDLYDVREDPRFPATLPFPLPDKGWLPSPVLLKLLDADPAELH